MGIFGKDVYLSCKEMYRYSQLMIWLLEDTYKIDYNKII